MTQTTTDNTELRIVRGNGFSVKITIEARRLDGTVIEDFSLADADATLNVIYYDTKTAYDFAVSDNDAVISFPSDLALGWYGLEMIGTYNGIAWRWCVQKVLQIVETNDKANIPNWTILADDTYIVSGVLTLTGADSSTQVQADWEQTDTTAKSYIKHKPDLTKYARLDESNEHESGTYDEWAGTNTQVKVSGSYITLTKYGDDGSVIQITPDRIRFVGTNTPNPFTGENWEYVLAAAQTQPDWEETDTSSHGYILNKPDLSEYVTSSTLATALAGYVTTSALTTALANYVTTSALATALAYYATQDWVEDKGYLTEHQDISGKENVTSIVEVASGTTNIQAVVDTYYNIAGEVTTLGVTLPEVTDVTKATKVVLRFTTSSSFSAITITSASSATVLQTEGFAIEASTTYEVNALWNGTDWVVAQLIVE